MRKALKRLEIGDLQTLLSVAESGSFRQASMRLSIGQPAVSRRIHKLEEALGVSLFERRYSGARLTRAGWNFVTTTRALLNDLCMGISDAESEGIADDGQLRIGLIASLSQGALRDLIAAFIDKHRDVTICFVEADRSEMLALLSHRILDVVAAAGDSTCHDSSVLSREEIYLAVSANCELAKQERLRWEDVVGETYLVSEIEPGPGIHDYIVRRVSDLGLRANIARHKLGHEGIMNLVGMGLGVSLVADNCRGVRYPNVTFVPIGDERESVPFSLTWRPENDNPALRRFLSLARTEARRRETQTNSDQQ